MSKKTKHTQNQAVLSIFFWFADKWFTGTCKYDMIAPDILVEIKKKGFLIFMADALAYLRQRQENGGFNELLGMRVRTIREGYAEIELPTNPNLLNALGNAHGGAIYALCDTAAGTAAASRGRVGVTLGGSIQYLRPGKSGQSLFAKTREIKVGKTTAVYGVTVTDETGAQVADATFTMFYIGENTELLK